MADEKALLIKAFKDVDRNGDGCFARADLAKVFQELEEWTEEDLTEMFDSFDSRKDGSINYTELVEWILSEEDDKDDSDREDSDADDAEEMEELDEAAEELGLDLEECVSVEEWQKIMRGMGQCEHEAKDMYERVHKDLEDDGEAQEGIPLVEFMDDLQIDSEDLDALRHMKQAVDRMKSGELDSAPQNHSSLDIAIDKIVRLLDIGRRPHEDAWEVAMAAPELARAGRVLVESTYGHDKAALVQAVKSADVSPPLIPASAGQTSNREHCRAKVEKIIEDCKAKGEKFTDLEWDIRDRPNEVLYVDKEKPGYDCTVEKPAAYKRLSELITGEQLFKGGIGAGDIRQGHIGTCFLLGAMGAIAGNNGKAIRHLFIKYDIQVGVYGVRFCLSGEWVHVVIDDIVPVDQHNRILYAHSKEGDELWVTLVEKAFCKLYTCYEMCDGGRPMDAIFNLFGGVSGKFDITAKHKADPGEYFKVLKTARMQGWLLTTTYVISKKAKKSVGKCGEAVLPTGLVGGHVYSVLKVVDACGVKLVKCRNPWGTGEWKGRFSDKNTFGEWTQELRDATGYVDANDGSFWMTIEDFVANSGGVEYARVFGPEWKKVTQHRQFHDGALQAKASWPYNARSKDELSMQKGATLDVLRIAPGWWQGCVQGSPSVKGFFPGNYVKLVDRPVSRFDLQGTANPGSQKPVRVVISLMQPCTKMMRKWKPHGDGLNYKDIQYPGLQLIVIGPDGKAALKRSGKKQRLSGEVKLPGGGLWKVYAISTTPDLRFSLRAYVKDGTATLTEIETGRLSEIMSELVA